MLQIYYFLGLYHPNAIFSMTCTYAAAQITSQNFKRISKYDSNARNILKMSDFSRAHTTLHIGVKNIMKIFNAMPSVSHDILNFNTDTIIFNVCQCFFIE